MFSRIFASESVAIPASQAGLKREATRKVLPITPSRRCISIMLWM
jgi:hypothetical protein